MNWLTAKTRITIGLCCLIVTLMITVASIGIGPNERRVEVANRAAISEFAAIGCSIHLNRNQTRELSTLLMGLKSRNKQIVSACIRRNNGRVETETGNHELEWTKDTRLSETHVEIPLSRSEVKWGSLEVLFQPVEGHGLKGMLTSRWAHYLVMTSALCFFVVYFFLGYVLKQLDPSKAVPKRVRNALNTLAEGLILTDKKGRVMLSNDAFAKWTGKHPDKLFGSDAKKIRWVFDDSQESELRTLRSDEKLPWELALETEAPQAGQLMKLETVDGEQITLVANSSPILGPNGKYVGVLTSFDDITELEEHKIELSLARIAADDANQAKSKFLARMSHEIRTPMNAILGYTEVLQFGLEDDLEKRNLHLSTIQTSGEHLLALINDILDLSKIESGQMEMELTKVSVHDLIKQVVSVLGIKAQEKGIKLAYAPAGKLPESIFVDGVRLKQAIINLVGNAIKFTSEGGVMIQPALVEQEGQMKLQIHVVDSGIGMTKSAMEKVFEPFSQADTSITRRFGGTGLGLTICRELCENMGGGIEVVSEPGKGSVFTITIDPGDLSHVKFLDEDELERLSSTRLTIQPVQMKLPDANVLIVDDGEVNRELVALFLKRANVRYEMAVDGKMAVDMIENGNFDVVLMDMHMPVMDGFEATRCLRARGNSIPIIALTADAMAQDERKCRDAGCTGFLPKPINKQRLFRALVDALPDAKYIEEAQPSADRQTTDSDLLREVDNINQLVHRVCESPGSDEIAAKTIAVEVDSESDALQTSNDFIESSLPMDDDDFVIIAKMFANNLQVKIESMDQAVDAADLRQLYELGHWLKGAGGSAGFDAFNAPGQLLEEFAVAKDLDGCRSLVHEIQRMFLRISIPDVPVA